MSATVIDGKAIAERINAKTALELKALLARHNLRPGLAVILVGKDPASAVYVGMKAKKCAELGIYSEKIELPENTSQAELLSTIDKLNCNPSINGILVQSPPPPQIDEAAVINAISHEKDVDCFHPVNVGKLLIGDEDALAPCTPAGIVELLLESGIKTEGAHCVIIGRSNIVGKPLMALLVRKVPYANATVTVCHSRTPDIASHTKRADILIAAIGKAEFVRGDMVKDGAVVIDVGINRVEDKSSPKGFCLLGDVAFGEVSKKASFITPVPGGIGPMTIAMLMKNTVKACKLQNKIPATI